MLNTIHCGFRYPCSWAWSKYLVWSWNQVILAFLCDAGFFRPIETQRISIYQCCWHKHVGSTQQPGSVWISQGSLPWTVIWDTRWICRSQILAGTSCWVWQFMYFYLGGSFFEYSQVEVLTFSGTDKELVIKETELEHVLLWLLGHPCISVTCYWHFILSFQSIWYCHGLNCEWEL